MSSKYKSLKKQFLIDLNKSGILAGRENKLNENFFIKRLKGYLINQAGSFNKIRRYNYMLKGELLKNKMLTEMNMRNNSGRKVKIIANPIPTNKIPLILEEFHIFSEYSIDHAIFEKIDCLNKQNLDFLTDPKNYLGQSREELLNAVGIKFTHTETIRIQNPLNLNNYMDYNFIFFDFEGNSHFMVFQSFFNAEHYLINEGKDYFGVYLPQKLEFELSKNLYEDSGEWCFKTFGLTLDGKFGYNMRETCGIKTNSLLPTFIDEKGKVVSFQNEDYLNILNMIKHNIVHIYETNEWNEDRLNCNKDNCTFNHFKRFEAPILIKENI